MAANSSPPPARQSGDGCDSAEQRRSWKLATLEAIEDLFERELCTRESRGVPAPRLEVADCTGCHGRNHSHRQQDAENHCCAGREHAKCRERRSLASDSRAVCPEVGIETNERPLAVDGHYGRADLVRT